MKIHFTTIENPLTRCGGYLRTVTSHSLQPYAGCSLGNSLCGVGCYVRHNPWVTRGRTWGSFLEVRTNLAEAYGRHAPRERRWARRQGEDSQGVFSIFLSSSTEPFPPQEGRFGITRSVLEAMLQEPPDELVLQTHSHRVAQEVQLLKRLAEVCRLRVHLSVETDRERLPGLPPPASPVSRRLEAAQELRAAGLRTVITVAPLLPMEHPERFFRRLGEVADAVVIDHFIGGDGSADGRRTLRTQLPAAMAQVLPESVGLGYRRRMVDLAREVFPGPVGVGAEGFAGRYLPAGEATP
ncbi:MAG: radical SAM protein [Acidobacteriota bacterium]|nr:radical SAM protein [Acidobacteriota bacterium]